MGTMINVILNHFLLIERMLQNVVATNAAIGYKITINFENYEIFLIFHSMSCREIFTNYHLISLLKKCFLSN